MKSTVISKENGHGQHLKALTNFNKVEKKERGLQEDYHKEANTILEQRKVDL